MLDTSSLWMAVCLGLLDPEDEGAAFLQNTGNHLPSNTASYPGRLESSATPV
jgi:hypothetical protein